MKKLNNI